MIDVEPVAIFPNAVPVQLWRTRRTPAAVTIRCGRGKRRCDRLAFVYDTAEDSLGSVVHFFEHIPSVPITMPPEVAQAKLDLGEDIQWDGQRGVALQRGQRDVRGIVVCLERTDYWTGALDLACSHHLGTIRVDRELLLTLLRESRRTGRPVEHSVSSNGSTPPTR